MIYRRRHKKHRQRELEFDIKIPEKAIHINVHSYGMLKYFSDLFLIDNYQF